MEMGRSLLDSLFPGTGALARSAMNYLGWGAYKGARNTILEASPVPTMHSAVDKGVRVVHKEFIGTINATVGYTNQRFSINPGVSATFPWLSTVASAFQKYKMNGLIFYFKSTAASMVASTDNSLGAVMGVTQYNPYELEPETMPQFLNISGAMEDKPSRDCIFPLECDRFHSLYPTYFVRAHHVSDDLAKYDPGVFNLATNGMLGTNVVGQLWVAYDVTLIQPVPVSVGRNSLYPEGVLMYELSGTASNSKPLGPERTLIVDNYYFDGSSESITVTDDAITIPPVGQSGANINLSWNFVAASAASVVSPTVTTTNLIKQTFNVPPNGSSARASIDAVWTVIDGTLPCTITFSNATLPTGALSAGSADNCSNLYVWLAPPLPTTVAKPPPRSTCELEEVDEKEIVYVPVKQVCRKH
jgi:hypothetical protein